MSEKPTNPKDAVGVKKATVSTVSGPFILAVGNAMLEGALKYGRHNYRTIGVRSSVYYDALMRHMLAWWEGQDIDPESGESHVVKAAACLAVLYDSMFRGNLNDDRPPNVWDGWVDEANAKAKALVEKYPDPKPAHTQADLYGASTPPLLRLIETDQDAKEAFVRGWAEGILAAEADDEVKLNARVEGAAYDFSSQAS